LHFSVFIYNTTTDYLAPWQIGYAEACKALESGSTPLGASKLTETSPERGFFCLSELSVGSSLVSLFSTLLLANLKYVSTLISPSTLYTYNDNIIILSASRLVDISHKWESWYLSRHIPNWNMSVNLILNDIKYYE